MTERREFIRRPVPSDVPAALDELGLDYSIGGDNAKILCLFHQDHSPSCYVHVDSGVFHCFVCDKAGQFVQLVQRVKGMSEEKAALWCQTRAIGRLRGAADRLELSSHRVDTTRVINEASLALFTAPPEKELRKRGIDFDAAESLGILWDPKERAWILPMRDEDGKLAGWQVKRGHDVWNYPGDDRKRGVGGVQKADYLFGLHAISHDPPVRGVLVESPLDVAVFRSAGCRSAVSSYGVRVSGVQLSLLTSHCDELIFAGDNDEAGWEMAELLRKEFKRLPLRFYNYGETKCKDPGEMWLEGEDILWGIQNATRRMTVRF